MIQQYPVRTDSGYTALPRRPMRYLQDAIPSWSKMLSQRGLEGSTKRENQSGPESTGQLRHSHSGCLWCVACPREVGEKCEQWYFPLLVLIRTRDSAGLVSLGYPFTKGIALQVTSGQERV